MQHVQGEATPFDRVAVRDGPVWPEGGVDEAVAERRRDRAATISPPSRCCNGSAPSQWSR
jgi:hypothetical protein